MPENPAPPEDLPEGEAPNRNLDVEEELAKLGADAQESLLQLMTSRHRRLILDRTAAIVQRDPDNDLAQGIVCKGSLALLALAMKGRDPEVKVVAVPDPNGHDGAVIMETVEIPGVKVDLRAARGALAVLNAQQVSTDKRSVELMQLLARMEHDEKKGGGRASSRPIIPRFGPVKERKTDGHKEQEPTGGEEAEGATADADAE